MLEYPEKSLNKIGNKQLFLHERIEGISSTIIPIASIERGLQVNTKSTTRLVQVFLVDAPSIRSAIFESNLR